MIYSTYGFNRKYEHYEIPMEKAIKTKITELKTVSRYNVYDRENPYSRE